MITYIKQAFKEAIDNNIQDITFFPHGEEYEVAFRKADVKHVYDHISSEAADVLFNHIKVMADMIVFEKRRGQLGTCDYQLDDGSIITIRISTVGDFRGLETMAIRLLDYPKACINGEEHRISLRDFHFDSSLEKVLERVGFPGLHIITGRPGVGKTTLAYLLLSEAFKEGQVMTIERHVEIKDVSFSQLQVNEVNRMDYNALVTLVPRFNPNVLFIGEANTREEVEAVLKAVSAGLSVVTTAYQDDFSIPHDVLEMKQGQDGKRNVALVK